MAASQSDLLIDDVYARLRDLILSNVLRAGQKLVDRDLAEQLGVSRTPVREALAARRWRRVQSHVHELRGRDP